MAKYIVTQDEIDSYAGERVYVLEGVAEARIGEAIYRVGAAISSGTALAGNLINSRKTHPTRGPWRG